MADSDKTEEASPHKLEEAREKGDVPKSREFVNFFILFGSALSFYFGARPLLQRTVEIFKRFFDFGAIKLETSQDYMKILIEVIGGVLMLLAPMLCCIFVFGIASHLVQFGLLFTTEKLSPDLEKLDPIGGFKKLFSMDSFAELIKSTIKIMCVSALFYLVLKGETEHLLTIGSEPVASIFMYFLNLIAQMVFIMLLFMAVLGISDFFYTRWSYAKKMRMTMQELKDEMKNREGDPMIKSRIRQMQRDRARARMMEEVPTADVIVTNPTHVAVALRYKRGIMGAPIVVAKGAGYIALKIKELAAEAGVPILERKQLARFIYKNVEVNHPIPDSLYTAVAEVLAYVYKMKRQFSQWRASHA